MPASPSIPADELYERIAIEADCSKRLAKRFVRAFRDVVYDAMIRGEMVRLPEFGRFYPLYIKARERRNPYTGEPVACPDTIQVKFRTERKARKEILKVVQRARKGPKRKSLAVRESGEWPDQAESGN